MITNRVMDYRLENGKTIRDIYEPGPFLKPLCESKCSNHLGFIELSDEKISLYLKAIIYQLLKIILQAV